MLGCKNGRVIAADEKIFEVIIELSIPSLREVCFIDTFTPPTILSLSAVIYQRISQVIIAFIQGIYS